MLCNVDFRIEKNCFGAKPLNLEQINAGSDHMKTTKL